MASNYTSYITEWRPPSFLSLKNILQPVRTGGHLEFVINTGRLKKKDVEYLQWSSEKGGLATTLCLHKLNCILQRPRVLQFNDLDFGVLENVELNIQMADYEQPFETVIVDLPKSYAKGHETHDPVFGTDLDPRILNTDRKESMYPMFVALTWLKHLKFFCIHIFLSNSDAYGVLLGSDKFDLESQIRGCQNTFIKSLPILEEEKEIYLKVIRAAVNASLYSMTCGLESGPENPVHYERLKNAQGSQTPGTDAYARFKEHPFIYRPKKSIAVEAGDFLIHNGGWKVKPHWRRPHWRMQRCGTGLSETRRVFIPAILVNKELL